MYKINSEEDKVTDFPGVLRHLVKTLKYSGCMREKTSGGHRRTGCLSNETRS
jgi:hypothetical protein